jgi:hypothetical protein
MTNTEIRPTDVFTHLIIACLTPMFLAATSGDPNHSRAAVIEIIDAHNPRTQADLLPIAQIIAFGLAVLSSISLSMTENLPVPLILRLRGNATSLNRATEQCRRALRETPAPSAAPIRPTELSEAERRVEEAVIAEVARTQQSLADYQASFDTAERQPTPAADAIAVHAVVAAPVPRDAPATMAAAMDATAADSRRRIDEAEAALKNPAQCPTKLAPSHIPMTEDEAHRVAWSHAMADVAREVTAEMARLPPAERRAAGVRAAALASAANHLMAGGPTPSPLILKTPRPSAP